MNLSRRKLLGTLAGAGACAAISPFVRAAGRRPNILIILADDLGYADISAYKSDRFHTPHIDRIGTDGVRFTDGYAAAPVCGPSRAGLLTGRYPDRFGFEFNDGPAARDLREGLGMATSELTIGQLLKDAGYHTGLIGKWHLGSQKQFYPMNRGFDEFVGFLPGETAYMDPKQPGLHFSYGSAGDEAIGARMSATVKDDDKGAAGERIEQTFYRKPVGAIVEGADHHIVHNENQYLTDYFGDRAIEFIQRNGKGADPYFLYLAFNAVHAPHMVTAKYYDRFPEIKDHQQRVYAAMVAALDEQVGRVLDAVGDSDTIVYFASDNGCAAYFPGLCSCVPLRGGKLSHYEGGVRVPFLMRWPGHVKPGTVFKGMVSLLDVLPTSLAAAGGKLPADREYDGVDIMPYLTGKKTGSPHNTLEWRRTPLYSIRDGDWKLWETYDDKTGQYGNYKLLFNLKEDPNETVNLAGRNPEKVKELEQMLRKWGGTLAEPKWPSKTTTTYDVCGTSFTLPI